MVKKKTHSVKHEHETKIEPGYDFWKISSVVLGALLVLSLFTNGFNITTVNGIYNDLKKLETKELSQSELSAVSNAAKELESVLTKENTNGDVVKIVEFSDFQCPYCAKAHPTVLQLLEEYGNKIEFEYKHFPLSGHPLAQDAAEASECARDQGKFMEYHNVLFTTKQLEVSQLKQHAADLGLNTAKFNSCLDNNEKDALVKEQFNEGRNLGVSGTPTFFINGEKLVGARPYADFAAAVDKALSGETPSTTTQTQQPTQQPAAPTVPKSDKPKIELFVMSHCPYGTQIEKGMLPVLGVLGDDVDFDLNFVYYAMHGEVEVKEQTRQYCIQRDQKELYLDYLTCFLEDGNSERCLLETGVDTSKVDSCSEEIDQEFGITAAYDDKASWLSGRYPLFNTDKEDNQKYGVRGSPTLIINGATVSSARDSASLLRTVCNAFNEKPDSCNTQFDSVAPGPGFGFDTTSGNAAVAGCGY